MNPVCGGLIPLGNMESIKPDIQCLVFVGASLEAVKKTKHWIYLRGVGGKKGHFGIILSFLVIPAGINLVSESEAAGSSRLATKIPSAAGFRIHGRKVPARNDTSNIHQGKEELGNGTDWMVSSCRWKRNKKLTFFVEVKKES